MGLAQQMQSAAAFVFAVVLASCSCGTSESSPPPKRVAVVLGSSTAFGIGPMDIQRSWVPRYQRHLVALNAESSVHNLSFPGFTTFNIQADAFSPPDDREPPAPGRNITAALELRPTEILINLPSNDEAEGHSAAEQLENYDRVVALAAPIPVWITSSQPRNFESDAQRESLKAVGDQIATRFSPRAIDFWTDLADGNGRILSEFDSGDGVHLNAAAHRVLYERVAAATGD